MWQAPCSHPSVDEDFLLPLQLPSQYLLLQVRCGYVLPGGVHSLPAQSSLCNSVCGRLLERSQPVCHCHPVHIRRFPVFPPSWTEEVWVSCSDSSYNMVVKWPLQHFRGCLMCLPLQKPLNASKCDILNVPYNLCLIVVFQWLKILLCFLNGNSADGKISRNLNWQLKLIKNRLNWTYQEIRYTHM